MVLRRADRVRADRGVVATMCRPGDDPRIISHASGRATAGFEITDRRPRRDQGRPGEILLRGRT